MTLLGTPTPADLTGPTSRTEPLRRLAGGGQLLEVLVEVLVAVRRGTSRRAGRPRSTRNAARRTAPRPTRRRSPRATPRRPRRSPARTSSSERSRFAAKNRSLSSSVSTEPSGASPAAQGREDARRPAAPTPRDGRSTSLRVQVVVDPLEHRVVREGREGGVEPVATGLDRCRQRRSVHGADRRPRPCQGLSCLRLRDRVRRSTARRRARRPARATRPAG